MIGLFCRILSLLWVSFAKETYHFKEPTNRSHPIHVSTVRSEVHMAHTHMYPQLDVSCTWRIHICVRERPTSVPLTHVPTVRSEVHMGRTHMRERETDFCASHTCTSRQI